MTGPRIGLRSSAALLAAAVLTATGCTDYVFDQAPAGCGFPAGTELSFGGIASPIELGVEGAPMDRTTRVEAYVTEEPIGLPDGSASRAICLVLVDGTDIDHWVRPVADDWEYLGQ